mmetsp:Transcript_57350/g.100763  ORF Transcript_57350/g.100763 Transcript_57350/m.100763 type:complete len:344 (+) Transcript_57350:201-1232(+)
MYLSGDFLLAVGAVLANVGLQVQLEVGVQGIHAVATGQRNQRVDREDEVGLEARLGRLLGAIAGRSANDQFVLLLVPEVDDAVPEPRGVHQHIAGAEHGGVALDLVQPGRRLGATLADQSLGVRGETLRVDRGLQVSGLGDRDEPPLLLTSNLAEDVDANGAVDVRTHVGHTHKHLRGLAVARLQAADLLVVDHLVKLGVVVKDHRCTGDVERLAATQLLEELAHGAVVNEIKQCAAENLLVGVLLPELLLVPGRQSSGVLQEASNNHWESESFTQLVQVLKGGFGVVDLKQRLLVNNRQAIHKELMVLLVQWGVEQDPWCVVVHKHRKENPKIGCVHQGECN